MVSPVFATVEQSRTQKGVSGPLGRESRPVLQPPSRPSQLGLERSSDHKKNYFYTHHGMASSLRDRLAPRNLHAVRATKTGRDVSIYPRWPSTTSLLACMRPLQRPGTPHNKIRSHSKPSVSILQQCSPRTRNTPMVGRGVSVTGAGMGWEALEVFQKPAPWHGTRGLTTPLAPIKAPRERSPEARHKWMPRNARASLRGSWPRRGGGKATCFAGGGWPKAYRPEGAVGKKESFPLPTSRRHPSMIRLRSCAQQKHGCRRFPAPGW